MALLLVLLITYLASGLLVLAGMYQFNRRIRQRIKDASYELFDRLAKRGTVLNRFEWSTMRILMYPAIWLFWVFILVGMVRGKYEGNSRKHRVNKGN